MTGAKADIIAQLQKEILPLQGFKTTLNSSSMDVGLGQIKNAFPNATFPLGAVHEFICSGSEEAAATIGFISGVLTTLMRNRGACIWISSLQTIFPPSLKYFGIEPDKIIFVDLQKEKEILWAMEESLKCDGLAAVVAEMKELSFTDSRRFQLAVEQNKVTGFIIRNNPHNLNTTACVTRWKITPLPSELKDDLPGVGFPRWNVELLKVRNGKPGSWKVEWTNGSFRHVYQFAPIINEQQQKTG